MRVRRIVYIILRPGLKIFDDSWTWKMIETGRSECALFSTTTHLMTNPHRLVHNDRVQSSIYIVAFNEGIFGFTKMMFDVLYLDMLPAYATMKIHDGVVSTKPFCELLNEDWSRTYSKLLNTRSFHYAQHNKVAYMMAFNEVVPLNPWR